MTLFHNCEFISAGSIQVAEEDCLLTPQQRRSQVLTTLITTQHQHIVNGSLQLIKVLKFNYHSQTSSYLQLQIDNVTGLYYAVFHLKSYPFSNLQEMNSIMFHRRFYSFSRF